jgi:hypothetical protein
LSFFKHFFIGFVGISSFVGGLNWLFDPYSIYNPPRINRLNTEKSPGAPRFFKPLQVSAQQPDVVILGSSRVQVGINPISIIKTYNFGIPGLTASELLGYGKHVLADTNVKRIVIGLDFFTFDDSQTISGSYALAVLGKNSLLRAIPETLFSFNSLNLSRKTLRRSYKQKPTLHQRNGLYQLPMPSGRPPEAIVIDAIQQFTSNGGAYSGQKQIERSLGELSLLLGVANTMGVTVDLFISPTHATFMEAIDMMKLWGVYENWKQGLTKIAATHKVVLWDFGGYTKLTTIPLANSQSAFFEGSHYLPIIGSQLLSIIHNEIEGRGFGQRLTTDNIQERLFTQRLARMAYRQKNTDDVALVKAIVCKYRCQ